jgi:bacillithiol biosynthesis cysteine-adding enzyme BshC
LLSSAVSPFPERAVSDCIPYNAIPHTSKLFLDYLFHFQSVAQFYPRPANRSWLSDEANKLDYDPVRRAQVAGVLERQNRALGAGEKTLSALQRFREGAVAIVTGQQVGLFGGPLYSLLKTASTLNAVAELNRSGVPAVAVFWLATEDHDLAEIDHALFPAGPGELREFRSNSKGQRNAPVGSIRFSTEIDQLVAEAAQLLGESPYVDDLQASYRTGETFGSAFGKLFARVFRDYQLIFIDPLDADLHRIVAPVYARAIEDAEVIDRELLERGKQLRDAGYHEQVKVTGESTLLFCLEGGERTVIHRGNGGFFIGTRKIAREELVARVKAHPEQFSPNALLRPVVQDYLLPTVAYFGGAAEVAYFAQASVAYQHLLGRVTPILSRLSATLVDQRMQRLLRRHQLSLTDLFAGLENLKELLGAEALPQPLRDALDVTTDAIRENIQTMQDALRALDPTLAQAAEKAGRKMRYQIERLRTKASRGELRRDQQLERDAAELIAGLYPAKTLQERELAGIALLAAHGPGLLDRLVDAASAECGAHQVISL